MPTNSATGTGEITAKNLLTAYEGESNVHARYLAYALKAEAEEQYGAASLFRAAARAEQIHLANQARVLRELGGGPVAEIQPTEVKCTLDNLKAAVAGEHAEVDPMYPRFIVEATEQGNMAAAQTFDQALRAEIAHLKLFSEAISLMEAGETKSWLSAPRNFFVCPMCGYTSGEREDEHCPVCEFAWERFEVVR